MVPFCFINVLQSIPTFVELGWDLTDQVHVIKITLMLAGVGSKIFRLVFVCVFTCMRERLQLISVSDWLGLKNVDFDRLGLG